MQRPAANAVSHNAAAERRGRTRRRGRGAALHLVQWGALLSLLASFLLWGFFVVDSAGQAAVQALGENLPEAPVAVLAAPRVLEVGQPASLDAIERELRALGYRLVPRTPREPGEYQRLATGLSCYRRAYIGATGEAPEEFVHATIAEGAVAALSTSDGRPLSSFVMEPVLLGAFRGPLLEERRPLPLARFPQRLIQAVMAAEDARFLRHRGIDFRAIGRALWADLRGGKVLQGGSTITQQVIKNRLVGSERTWLRKAHEALLAAYVEGKVSKERLLEIYLNEVYLGQRGAVSVVGMPAGAAHYFGKNLDDLSLQQMALLAGLIASPGRFEPRRDPQAARERLRWVLRRMADLGYIDAAEAEAAGRAPLGLAPLEDPLDSAGDVLDAVRRELEVRGLSPRPGRERVPIHTTIDVELQAAARRGLDETLADLERAVPSRAPLEGAVVILRPATGEVLALVGGRQGVRGGFHRALDAHRQPGSAFKPFVALAAFASGAFLPSTIVDDSPLAVMTAQGPWTPRDFDGEFRGPVSVRRALEESLNVPMARVGIAVGPEQVVRWARRVGVAGRLPAEPALALGAGEATPLEMATAYATLANLGTKPGVTLVAGATLGPAGASIPLSGPARPAPAAAPPDACWMVLDALSGVVPRGTGRALAGVLQDARVAAKTGTTQDGRDAWFALITGDAVVIVYIGRDDDRPADLVGAGAALPVARRIVAEARPRILAPLPGPPEGLTLVEVDPETGGRAGSRCPTRVMEVFRVGDEPKACPKHASFFRRLWRRLSGEKDTPPAAGQRPGGGRR